MWSVIEFLDTKEVAVIPNLWLIGNKNCYWPKFRAPSILTNAVMKSLPPDPSWEKYSIRIFKSYKTYNDARFKLPRAEKTSELSSDEAPKGPPGNPLSETSSDDEQNEVGVKRKRGKEPLAKLPIPPKVDENVNHQETNLSNQQDQALLGAHDSITDEYIAIAEKEKCSKEEEIIPVEFDEEGDINIVKPSKSSKSLKSTSSTSIKDFPSPSTISSYAPTPQSPWDDLNIMRHKSREVAMPLPKFPNERFSSEEEEPSNVIYGQPIRIISLRKSQGVPLGVTVEEDSENGNLVVARIISGGMIDRLGLLKIGDVILEVNTVNVQTPAALQAEIAKARDTLQLKVGAPLEDRVNGNSGRQVDDSPISSRDQKKKNLHTSFEGQKTLCFMRSCFAYDPSQDTLLPCNEIGLGFQMGDILQIVDQSDANWWQARKVGENVVGLIPSRELEERRAAFVRPEHDFVHSIGICGTRIARKKKKCVYTAKQNFQFDKAELVLYEEVTRMPPFRRKTLVLIGTTSVGRRTLKNRLLNSDPYKFGSVLPITSRPPREGEEQMNIYTFITTEEFEEGIRENAYLEFGEKDGHYYGTTFESVRDVIRQGKMCILDCAPTALKILHNSPEMMPYVVFLAAPGADNVQRQEEFERNHGYSSRTMAFDRMSSIRYSSRRARTLESIASLYEEDDNRQTVEESQRLQRLYQPLFDLVVINEDFDETFRKTVQALDALSTEHQWVPVSWVY